MTWIEELIAEQQSISSKQKSIADKNLPFLAFTFSPFFILQKLFGAFALCRHSFAVFFFLPDLNTIDNKWHLNSPQESAAKGNAEESRMLSARKGFCERFGLWAAQQQVESLYLVMFAHMRERFHVCCEDGAGNTGFDTFVLSASEHDIVADAELNICKLLQSWGNFSVSEEASN